MLTHSSKVEITVNGTGWRFIIEWKDNGSDMADFRDECLSFQSNTNSTAHLPLWKHWAEKRGLKAWYKVIGKWRDPGYWYLCKQSWQNRRDFKQMNAFQYMLRKGIEKNDE